MDYLDEFFAGYTYRCAMLVLRLCRPAIALALSAYLTTIVLRHTTDELYAVTRKVGCPEGLVCLT